MIHLRRKKKEPQPLDERRMREIIQQELSFHDSVVKDASDKERARKIKLERIKNLPKNKRRQLVKFLRKRVADGKK